MFKFAVVICAVIAYVAAKPGLVAPLAYSAPLAVAAPGVVTATSSQVFARNYNGIAAAPVLAAAPVVKYVAAPVGAPLGVASPLVAAPLAARYAASPLSYPASFAYSSSLIL